MSMAERKIMIRGTPVLHRRAADATPDFLRSDEGQKLVQDMLETMIAAKGVGIAAPQVGVGLRVFIAESPEGPIALANPKFSRKSKKMQKDEEGCLSVPGEYDTVLRHKSLHVDALTMNGEPISFDADGFFARVLQHENDHLEGILFVDRVAEQKKK